METVDNPRLPFACEFLNGSISSGLCFDLLKLQASFSGCFRKQNRGSTVWHKHLLLTMGTKFHPLNYTTLEDTVMGIYI